VDTETSTGSAVLSTEDDSLTVQIEANEKREEEDKESRGVANFSGHAKKSTKVGQWKVLLEERSKKRDVMGGVPRRKGKAGGEKGRGGDWKPPMSRDWDCR
jgi:hypothetical protein